jgi:hypothetical protein
MLNVASCLENLRHLTVYELAEESLDFFKFSGTSWLTYSYYLTVSDVECLKITCNMASFFNFNFWKEDFFDSWTNLKKLSIHILAHLFISDLTYSPSQFKTHGNVRKLPPNLRVANIELEMEDFYQFMDDIEFWPASLQELTFSVWSNDILEKPISGEEFFNLLPSLIKLEIHEFHHHGQQRKTWIRSDGQIRQYIE